MIRWPAEFQPRSLCNWGGGGDGGGGGWGGDSGGGGWGGDSGGGGWGGDSGGFGGPTTGGGDWGSSGSYDASSFQGSGDLGAWAGTAYDASSFPSGTLGGGDWGSFGATNYSGMDSPNAIFTDIAGPNPGVTTGGGDWGSAGTFSAAGTGGGPAGAMFGADLGAGAGAPGQLGGSGWTTGDYGVGGNPFGEGGGGGGGGYFGGGGPQGGGGGGSFGGFGSAGTSAGGKSGGALGGSNMVSSVTGPAFADTVGAGSLAGPAGKTSSEAPTTSEAQVESAAPSESEAPSQSEAAPESEAAPLGTPTTSEAAPEVEAGPSLTDAAPAGMIGGTQDAAPTSAGGTTAPAQTSNFGPQSVNADYQGSPYADMGPQGTAPSTDYQGSPYADMGPPSQAYNDAAQQLSDLTQSALSGYDYQGSPYADMGQPTAPDFNQAFQAFEAQPGWNPAEQTAGRAGLAEPTDWAANPYAPSTDVSVGRDFNQAFEPFADTPTGMDLAGDQRSETEPSLTFNEMWGATPYTTLPNDPLSRSAQETLESDFGYFPNPGYVQGPPQQSFNSWINDAVNAALNPVGRALDYLPSLPNPTLDITNPATAWSNFVQNALLGGSNIQSLNPEAFTSFEAGQQGRAGAHPDTTPWGSVFEGAAPTEAQPAIESFIPGGRETNFEYNVAPTQAPIDVEVVRSDDPSVPADPRGDPATPPADTLPPAVPTDESGRPVETPESGRPAEQPSEAPPSAPPQQPPQAPQVPPSLIEQGQQPPPQAPPTAPPGLVTMLPPPALTPPAQPPGVPTPETRPAETPSEPGEPGEPDEHDDAPEPQDTSQPPQDPNAPRPPDNIPGQLVGSRGTYQNERADNPRTNRNYLDSGRLDNPQGEPGITFRSARQAGIEPLFRIGDINVRDVDARLVENINRALRDMERLTGIPANSLVATSGQRFAHRGGALIHGMDPRTSQESVRSRGNPSGGGGFPAAPPGRSNHGAGRALDFAASPARTWLRDHAREYGLETLGRNFDLPHIQLQRGQGGQRPSEQEQAEQRAINEQNRQAAIDRGLIAPGRGNQQAGVPTPRARPSDAPQPDVAVPRPPADIPPPAPPAALPPADRPPADIPAPPRGPNEYDIPVTPAARGRLDPGVVQNIIKQATAHLNTQSGEAAFQAASVVAAKEMARAGVPLATARSLMTKSAYEGAEKVGYGPSSMGWSLIYKGRIDGGIEAALQGYQPAKSGEVQGPPSPAQQRSEAPFGSFVIPVAGGRDVGQPPAISFPDDLNAAIENFRSQQLQLPPGRAEWEAPLPGGTGEDPSVLIEGPEFSPPAPPPAFQAPSINSRGIDPHTLMLQLLEQQEYQQDFNPRGWRALAKGGHVAKDEPVVVGEEGPEYFVPDQPGTVVPHMPQPGQTERNIDRWPKVPAVGYPGQYGGVEREIRRQTRSAQDPVLSLMDMIDSERLRLNAANWHRMINDPSLIALGRSRIEDRR